MTREELIKNFEEKMGKGGEILTFFAPGRVNLIGEHTDYNGGHVFPCALTIGTYGAIRKRDDDLMRFFSLNFPHRGVLKSSIRDIVNTKEAGWSNYPRGVVWAMSERGMVPECGFDMLIYGNIPNGSGLSSSASVELLTGVALRGLFGFSVDNQELALIGQYSENHFNGVNCGIMDQFAIAMGKKDHAIFLDTATLQYTYAPLKLEGARIVIASSNKKRGLGDSKYNERRSECEAALAMIQKEKNVPSLGALTPEEFEEVSSLITDPVMRKRARHAVLENARTVEAVKALENGDVAAFGKLMNESHISLRDDYEVTGRELDTLVESAWKQEGVLGSRMTGAGFGGCTVSIVREDAIDAFIRNVGEEYVSAIGYAADFYVVDIGDGAGEF
ncbi:MAG: galactokinase [Lachnospiraceae bacterium]|nr:galactokinase [Lachnospiraceae bacterium]